jgi:hypothetical protein
LGEKATLTAKVEAVATIGILIFAIVAVYFAVDANNRTLELQTQESGFEPKIVRVSDFCWLGNDNYYLNGSNPNSITKSCMWNASFAVITPHASIVSIDNVHFQLFSNDQYSNTPLDQTKINSINVNVASIINNPNYFPPESQFFALPTVSIINFTVPVWATYYLSPSLPSDEKSNFSNSFSIGVIYYTITVTDLQSQKTIQQIEETPVQTQINFI